MWIRGRIRSARNQREVSQQDLYRHSRIILQPTDTTENWPRIGFEAMASGCLLYTSFVPVGVRAPAFRSVPRAVAGNAVNGSVIVPGQAQELSLIHI